MVGLLFLAIKTKTVVDGTFVIPSSPKRRVPISCLINNHAQVSQESSTPAKLLLDIFEENNDAELSLEKNYVVDENYDTAQDCETKEEYDTIDMFNAFSGDDEKREKGNRLSELDLKMRAYDNNRREKFFNSICHRNCPFSQMQSKSCPRELKHFDVTQLLKEVWGDREVAAPSTTERGETLFKILLTAWQRDPRTTKFDFFIGNTPVCEYTFTAALGLRTEADRVHGMWQRLRTHVASGHRSLDLERKKLVHIAGYMATKKNHCILWITSFAQDNCSLLPSTLDMKHDRVFVVPFDYVRHFYSEYKYAEWDSKGTSPEEEVPCERTFSDAFKSLTHIRLMRCKGSFATCTICAAAG